MAMVTFGGRNPLAMSSVTPPEGRLQGLNFTPHHYKPFSSHEHYQQVMCALHKLQQSGFYWGAISGREANSLLRSQTPGTFLVRDSSDHHYFFTLSVQTIKGTRNLRIHSEGGGFFLQADPPNTQELPKFDCVLKLIEHYMGKGEDTERTSEGASGGNSEEAKTKARIVYLIDSSGEKIPLELLRPLMTSLSSLQHMCRRTLNNQRPGALEQTEALPHTIRDFLQEYDSPI
ncbi:suppressor of cytokine signaling 3b [Archocentrus centrarchus]|nr:suppressor of cytokine signaling 3-like [Archocentrus centrarchus]